METRATRWGLGAWSVLVIAFLWIPLAIIVLILGVYPHAILDLLGASLNHVNQVVLMAHAPAAATVP